MPRPHLRLCLFLNTIQETLVRRLLLVLGIPNISLTLASENPRDPRVLIRDAPNSHSNASLDRKASLGYPLVGLLLDLELLGRRRREHADVDLSVNDVDAERSRLLESLLEVGLSGCWAGSGGGGFLGEVGLVADAVDADAVGLDEFDDSLRARGFGIV